MLKLIGAAVIAIACAFAVTELARQNKKRTSECEGFLELLRLIRTRIADFSEPLASIYTDFSNPALDSVGFTAALAHGDFAAALEACRERLSLDCESFEMLCSFARELGMSYRSEQLSSCDRYIAELEARRAYSRTESTRKTKLACSLTVTFGLMLIILLV